MNSICGTGKLRGGRRTCRSPNLLGQVASSRRLVWSVTVGWILILIAVAGAADEIGLFFDERGETACLQTPRYSPTTLYLLLLEPSASGGVSGWECSLEFEGALLVSVVLAGSGTNFYTAPDFVVGIGTLAPLPRAPVVALAQLSLLTTGTTSSFYVRASPQPSLDEDLPAYADGQNPAILIPMIPREIGPGGLVAGVNLPNCTPVSASWGEVKTSFE